MRKPWFSLGLLARRGLRPNQRLQWRQRRGRLKRLVGLRQGESRYLTVPLMSPGQTLKQYLPYL